MAKRKRTKPPPRRAKRSLLGVRPSLRLAGWTGHRFQPEPHQLDVIALALIAVGIFLAGVAYLRWSGGPVGSGAITALRFVFGLIGYAVPTAFVVAGALLLLRELRA